MKPQIGDWVRRAGRHQAKYHLMESEVNEAAIIKCGKAMDPVTTDGDALEAWQPTPGRPFPPREDRCRKCDP